MTSYLTTPIYYVNAPPHLGHAFTTVIGDILKRHRTRLGIGCLLSTGCDEHGQKNAKAAAAMGLPPQPYLDLRSAEFRSLFDRLDVGYDVFARTTAPNHVREVQRVLTRLHAQGHLRLKAYEGHYCAGCEQFKTPSDLLAGGHCREHPNMVAARIREENYFLHIEPFRERIRAHVLGQDDFVRPRAYRAELLGLLGEPLEDLCISRPANRVPLGIPFPFDARFVAYVWFDALLNYLTNLNWPAEGYRRWWQAAEHLIGKDILKTHGVYWPAMLLAMGEALPRRLLVHGHWTGEGGLKMSKSLGNTVDPNAVIDDLGADALRYFFARNLRPEQDSPISPAMIRQTYIAELANKIGNLHARVVALAVTGFQGRVPARAALSPADHDLRSIVLAAAQRWSTPGTLEDLSVWTAGLLAAAERLNGYVASEQPWLLARSAATRERFGTVLYVALDALRLLFEALWPVIPRSSERALAALGSRLEPDSRWVAQLDVLEAGSSLGAVEPLFPKPEVRSAAGTDIAAEVKAVEARRVP